MDYIVDIPLKKFGVKEYALMAIKLAMCFTLATADYVPGRVIHFCLLLRLYGLAARFPGKMSIKMN